uniref:Uncharacterized protein n=1 Tax=Romanomermis culicivorax TaxID=13658 RepID=A0A915IVP8_ROMCU
MARINTTTAHEFYLAISEMFEQTTPQAVAFYRLRMCRQQPDETRLFSSPIVSLDAFIKIMQAVKNAESSTTIVGGEKQVNAMRKDQ